MNVNEFDVVIENILDTKVTLYHGSDTLYKTLEPVALDLGNTFQKPGWSLFCFKEKDIAINWAIMRALCQLLREMKRKNAPIDKFDDFFIWNGSSCKLVINGGNMDKLSQYMTSVPTKGYVYTVNVKASSISFGNDAGHPEYTVRENHIKPTKIDKIMLTKSNITKYCDILDESQYINFKDNIKSQWNWMSRGLLSLLLTNDWSYNVMYNKENIKRIRSDISNGILKPGDDIEMYLHKNNLTISHISPFQRVKMQATGLIQK